MPAAWRSGCMCRRPALFATTSWKAHYYPALQHRTPRHKSTQYSQQVIWTLHSIQSQIQPSRFPSKTTPLSLQRQTSRLGLKTTVTLLPAPPPNPKTCLHTLLAKRQGYSRGSDGKLSALSVTDTYTWNAPETSIQSKSFYRPSLIQKITESRAQKAYLKWK